MRLIDAGPSEQRGTIRYLRPDFQNPKGSKGAQQSLDLPESKSTSPIATRKSKIVWPKSLPEQFKALRSILQQSDKPLSAKSIASQFKNGRVGLVEELLDTLASLSQARKHSSGGYTL